MKIWELKIVNSSWGDDNPENHLDGLLPEFEDEYIVYWDVSKNRDKIHGALPLSIVSFQYEKENDIINIGYSDGDFVPMCEWQLHYKGDNKTVVFDIGGIKS